MSGSTECKSSLLSNSLSNRPDAVATKDMPAEYGPLRRHDNILYAS